MNERQKNIMTAGILVLLAAACASSYTLGRNIMRLILTFFALLFCVNIASGADACVTINNTGGISLWGGRFYNSGGSPVGGSDTVDLAPGASDTLTMTGYGANGTTQNIKFGYYTNAALTGTRIYHPTSGTSALNFGGLSCPTISFSHDIPTAGTSDPTTNQCNVTICVNNNTTRSHTYTLWKNGVEFGATGGCDGGVTVFEEYVLHLPPGGSGCSTFSVACTNSTGWSLNYWSCEGISGIGQTNYAVNTNTSTVPYPSSTNLFSQPPPNAQFGADTNAPSIWSSNIVWRAQDSTNAITSQQRGDNAIYDAITKQAAADDVNARQAATNANRLLANTTSGFNGLSNEIAELAGALGGTNGSDGVRQAVRSFHVDNTNLLTQIMQNQTNQTAAQAPAIGTNQTAATEAAMAIIGDINDSAQDAIDGIGTAPAWSDTGDATALTFEMAGHVISLDPEVRFPGIGAVFKGGLILVLTLSLGRYLANLYKETAATFAASQTGGSPDLAFAGFNIAGPIVGVAVAGIVVVLWVVVFALMFSYAMDTWLGLQDAGEWGLGNAAATYLLNYFLPVGFMLSCAWTRIIAPIGVTKLVVITNSIQRFLLGK